MSSDSWIYPILWCDASASRCTSWPKPLLTFARVLSFNSASNRSVFVCISESSLLDSESPKSKYFQTRSSATLSPDPFLVRKGSKYTSNPFQVDTGSLSPSTRAILGKGQQGLLGTSSSYWALLGLIGKSWLPVPRL